MRTTRLLLLAATFAATTALPANAQLLDFEDRPEGVVQIPNGYAGLNWVNFYTISRGWNPGSGYDNTMSGDRAAFNGFGDASAFSGSTFDLAGFSLGAAWNSDLNVEVAGLLNGVTLFQSLVVVGPYAATQVNLGWTGINELRFRSFGGNNEGLGGSGTHFVLDNVQLGQAQVPEPMSMILLGTGLAGVALMRRRRGLVSEDA